MRYVYPYILEDLKTIARVYAVRGNMDVGRWSNKLPLTRVVDVGETLLYVLHNLNNLDLDPVSSGFHAVISGHLHRPIFEKQNGILYINPGSASQPRHEYSPTIALLSFKSTKASSISVNFVEL